jgi:hypothetical protein
MNAWREQPCISHLNVIKQFQLKECQDYNVMAGVVQTGLEVGRDD